MTRIQPTDADGRPRTSAETRAKLSVAGKARFAGLPPDEQERIRQTARDRLARRKAPPAPPGPPAAGGGPRSPLDDAPRAAVGALPSPDRSEGRPAGHVGAPIFRVPDFDPLPPAPDLDGPPLPDAGEPAIAVSQAQVEDLLRFPFALAAVRRGDHWKLRDAETEMVAAPLTRKLNESAVAARAIALGGDWTIIIGGLAVLVSSRLAEDAKHDRTDAPHPAARSGGLHPSPVDGDGGLAAGLGAARPGGGSLNGFGAFTLGPLDD